jgi:membrane associated rhomboid family serine protease
LSSATADPEQGGVAFLAHVGGFISGMILIPFFRRKGVRFFNTGRSGR